MSKKKKAADLFAGWGGMSIGAEMGGVEVIWAANHWELAVQVHQKNLPNAIHVCQDLNQTNFYDIPDIDLLLAAPECQGHTKASQPRRRRYHDQSRATAWAVVSCADAKEPEHIVVENVPEFRHWRLYESWLNALKNIGYELEEHILTASYHGVPQRRKRLFIIGSLNEKPGLEFPPKTTEPGSGTIIEDTEIGWRPVASSTKGVQERIARGRAKWGDHFFTQHTTGHSGVPFDEPLRTITTQDQWALVDGDMYRPLTVNENRAAMGFPDDYILPSDATRGQQITGLGNAVCPPVARDIVAALY